MTNLEAAVAVLTKHREARQWSDEAVAADLLTQLGLDAPGDAKNAAPVVPPGITEDEVLAQEAAAKEAADKAKAAREALDAQAKADAGDTSVVEAKADEAADTSGTSGRSRGRGAAGP